MSHGPHYVREVGLVVSYEMQGLSVVVGMLHRALQDIVLDAIQIQVDVFLPVDFTDINIELDLVFWSVGLEDFVLVADIEYPLILSEVAKYVSPLFSSAYQFHQLV